MGSIGDMFGSIGGAIASGQMAKAYGSQEKLAEIEAKRRAEEAKKAKEGLKDYTVGRAGREAYMMSQQDKAGDIIQRQIEKQAAQGLGALTTGGAKAMIGGGGVGALQSASADRIQQAAAESQARKMQGQNLFAGQEQSVLDANVAGSRDVSMYDYGRASQLGQLAEQRGRQMGLSQTQAQGQATQQGFTAAGQAGDVILDAYTMGMVQEGAKVKKTPGEFSHESNPIDLVRNGTKIGEATGGELIFNPEQSGKLETLATEGSTELHKYLRGLFKKFNKKS
tara:strand:+ start:687 stop:1529 length:843 start_codon:yes stop_codon:yes gene_type:complete